MIREVKAGFHKIPRLQMRIFKTEVTVASGAEAAAASQCPVCSIMAGSFSLLYRLEFKFNDVLSIQIEGLVLPYSTNRP